MTVKLVSLCTVTISFRQSHFPVHVNLASAVYSYRNYCVLFATESSSRVGYQKWELLLTALNLGRFFSDIFSLIFPSFIARKMHTFKAYDTGLILPRVYFVGASFTKEVSGEGTLWSCYWHGWGRNSPSFMETQYSLLSSREPAAGL